MLSPISAAGVNPAVPAGLAPPSMTPRPDDPSQAKPFRETGARFDPVPPADPAGSEDIAPIPKWEPDPIRPSPEKAARFDATSRDTRSDDAAAPSQGPGVAQWEPDPFKPGIADETATDKVSSLAVTGDDDTAPTQPPGLDALQTGRAGWEPETFRPASDGDIRLTPATVKAGGDDEEALARPSPAETAAYEQAVKGYAQLGSYASIQWKLNMAA